jgi:hypothetical protein
MSILPQAAKWPKGVLLTRVLRFKISQDLGTLYVRGLEQQQGLLFVFNLGTANSQNPDGEAFCRENLMVARICSAHHWIRGSLHICNGAPHPKTSYSCHCDEVQILLSVVAVLILQPVSLKNPGHRLTTDLLQPQCQLQ